MENVPQTGKYQHRETGAFWACTHVRHEYGSHWARMVPWESRHESKLSISERHALGVKYLQPKYLELSFVRVGGLDASL